MAQQVRVSGQPDAGGQPGEGAAGVIGIDRRAPLGAKHQVQLDRAGWPAGLHPAQPHRGGLPAGQAQPELLVAVTSQRLNSERWQGEDGVAGCGLHRSDGQLLAPAADAVSTAVVIGGGVGEDLGVDDGERLAEPDRSGVQVEVGPFQAAQLAVAGAGRCREYRPGAEPWRGGVVGA
jgi:hypothetical protein